MASKINCYILYGDFFISILENVRMLDITYNLRSWTSHTTRNLNFHVREQILF